MTISIITINYNNKEGLLNTIRSVVSQTYQNIEYIVVDGGSTDGSVEVITQYQKCMSYWVSEKDKGIYHAMNKGIKKATGDYCLFLNSGDCLHSPDALETFVNCLSGEDLLMGRTICVPSGRIGYADVHAPFSLMDFYVGNPVPHQACLIRRTLFIRHLYDESLRIVSDWKFFLQVLVLEGCTYRLVDNVVTNFLEGGISANRQRCDEERSLVLRELLPEAILIDYRRFENGTGYVERDYDKFFADLRKYNLRIACIIYRFSVMITKLFSYVFSSLQFARRFPSRCR